MDIVTDILDFSKIESQTVLLHETAFNVNEVVKEIMSFMAPKAQEKGISLDYTLSSDKKSRIGDHGRLRQILINLVNNAIKFTEEGSVTVSVDSLADAGVRKGTVLFAVSDTGVGIPADQRELIFDSFYQVDGSSTRKYGGSGLGLAISKELVGLMGGEIWAEDAVHGHGTVFKFTLDLKEVEGVAAESAQPPGRGLEGRQAGGKKQIQILLAEDDLINRTLALALLEQRGYAVSVVENGRLAVEKIKEKAGVFDLVLMDVQMPEMDGFEATHQLRSLERKTGGEHLPIIAMTAHAFQKDRDRCLEEGMDDYLAKPINAEKLYEMVERHC
jgi:CheY-like chemotaxis protein